MGSCLKAFSEELTLLVYRHLDSESVGAPVQIGSLGKKSPQVWRRFVRIKSGSGARASSLSLRHSGAPSTILYCLSNQTTLRKNIQRPKNSMIQIALDLYPCTFTFFSCNLFTKYLLGAYCVLDAVQGVEVTEMKWPFNIQETYWTPLLG